MNIKLRDLNDESPKFGQEDYVFSVLEREDRDTLIGCVNATDRDVFDKVT